MANIAGVQVTAVRAGGRTDGFETTPGCTS